MKQAAAAAAPIPFLGGDCYPARMVSKHCKQQVAEEPHGMFGLGCKHVQTKCADAHAIT